MKEIRDIIRAFDLAQQLGKQTALATVVQVEGSSYRRPGARMLITEDGELTGAISGGCLEGDALRKARLSMIQKMSLIVSYDTMDDEDATIGLGLGCNGVIHVLIEPIDQNDPCNPIVLLKKVAAQREKAVLITLFSLQEKKDQQEGTCLLITANNILEGRATSLKDILINEGRHVLAGKQSIFRNYIAAGRKQSAFIELIKPAVSLVIAGAGNDVVPLVDMATILGWETTVIDGRPALAKKERFALGCQVMLAKPEKIIDKLHIDEYTVFVLMTHNYNYDLAMLQSLLHRNVSYVGMLGPKKKIERMLDDLSEKGMQLTRGQLGSIHSPVGLDLGAENPEEIALSIISEIKAVLSGRKGFSLHANTGSIHERDEWVNISITGNEHG